MTIKTKSQLVAEDIQSLLRARTPLLVIETKEESRAEEYLAEAAAAAGYTFRTWDVAAGMCELDGKPVGGIGSTESPDTALRAIAQMAAGGIGSGQRNAWIMRDLPVWLQGPGGAPVLRQLRNLCRALPGVADAKRAQALIMLNPPGELPPELQAHATVIEWPLPDRSEIAELVDLLAEDYSLELNGQRDLAIDAAVGLTYEEAQACYSKSIVQTKAIDPRLVAQEKKRVIARDKVLEWHDPLPGGLDAVGGLDVLKGWLMQRAIAWTPDARAYGLPMPRGAFIFGVSGCGKSHIIKAFASYLGVPLLRLDPGALKSKFVGDSERQLRLALRTIEAIGRCVVWIDELEKALQGAIGGAADGGVSADQLGALLNWMQERTSEAFVMATANDVSLLPPEILRKGRWDELFFVDVPTQPERVGVLQASLRKYRCDDALSGKQEGEIALACDGFTGAEIDALVPDGLFRAFSDGKRPLKADDLLTAAKSVVPLSRTSKEKIDGLRKWASERARLASDTSEAINDRVLRAKARRALDVAK